MLTVAVEAPVALVAVTVYDVELDIEEGIPEMIQVELLMKSPDGKLGDTVQFTIELPLLSRVVGDTLMSFPTSPDVPVAPV
jgi:hypothetical protein